MNRIHLHILTVLCMIGICMPLSAQSNDSALQDSARIDSVVPVRSYPTGNTFMDPIVVPVIPSTTTHYAYSNEVNTNDFSNNYTGLNRNDVYYAFSIPKEMIVTLTHNNSYVEDTYIYLLNSSLTLLEENDDYYGEGHCYYPTQAYLHTCLPAGSYYVVTEGKSYGGYITTNMTFDEIPVGDSRTSPIVAGTWSGSFNYSDTCNTSLYTDRTGLSTNDVFYRITLSQKMNVTVTNDGSALNDTYLYLLNSSGSVITCNDNYSGGGHCSDTCQAFINRVLDAGTYYVVTEGKTLNGSITTHISGNAEAGYGYPVIPSSYDSDPGNAVGGMGGQFGVSAMGGATYSIPITVPQGVGGLQPQLSIVYNSQTGNGLCGYGASLAGISSITRGPKYIYHDNAARGISFLADDALYLDGVRLILSSGTAGQNNAVYHPESDPFTEVKVHNSCTSTSNDIWFEVKSSDGMVYEYGYKSGTYNNAILSYDNGASQRIYSWYISCVRQPNGNYMEYTYLQSGKCVYPYKIRYGGNENNSSTHFNEIEFGYEYRSDEIPVRFDGQKGSMEKRLKTITGRTDNTTYRSYTLNYNTTGDGSATKFSRLTGITEKNDQNETLPATQFFWSFLPTVSYQSSTITINVPSNLAGGASMPFADQTYLSGDLNGDGLCDMVGIAQEDVPNNDGGYDSYTYLYIYYASKTITNTIQYVSGNSFQLPPSTNIGDHLISEINALSVFDLDGDGMNELIMPFFNQTGSSNGTIWLYTLGQSYDENDLDGRGLYGNERPLFSTGDVDNDGKTEVLFMETSKRNGKYPVYIFGYNINFIHNNYTSGHTLYAQTELNLSLSSTPKRVYLTDMNNNGLKDLLVICEDDYTVFWNQGGTTLTAMYSDSYKTTRNDFDYWRMTAPGDFNGDGLLDFLTTAIGSNAWKFFVNNGDGTFNMSNACLLDLYDQPLTNLDDDKFHCDILDFDGDGKDDVVITKAMFKSDELDHTHTYWMRSTGTNLTEVYHATSTLEEDALANKFITGDFDGDGRMELINYGYDCAHGVNSNSSPVWRIYKNSGLTVQSGKVTSVTGDYGATTNITYSTLTDQSIYTRGTAESYPAPRFTIPLNVVKQTVQSNGAACNVTTGYTYEGLKAHLRGRGLLGFSKVTADNTTTGITTQTGITQWDTAHYIPKVSYSRTSIDGTNYISQSVSTLTVVDKGSKKYFAYPSVTVETDMDGFTATSHISYDTLRGYITSDSTTFGTNMYRVVSYKQYTNNKMGGAYRPQIVVSTQRHPDDTQSYSNTTQFTYDSTTGVVTSKVDHFGSSKPLTTSYTYDAWGNVSSQVSTYTGYNDPCTTYYVYDVTHRFPLRIYTNPASSVRKYTYDTWGNVLTYQDSINTQSDNTVYNTYDHWGTLVSTQYPEGDEVTYTRGWSSDPAQRWYVLEQGLNRPWVKTWYDEQGRIVRTESVGPKNVNLTSITAYNDKGQVSDQTEIKGDLTLSNHYEYDERGRKEYESYSGNGNKRYTYGVSNGLRTVSIKENDNNYRITTNRYDVWGNLKSVSSPLSGSITNSYCSHGGIKSTLSGGATWSFEYDDHGNRTKINDPDAGTTTYVYDAFDREIQRTDARGVAFVTDYDYLGRVTSTTASQSGQSETITYTYGGSSDGTAQMRLKSKSLNGWTKSFTYDSKGRVTQETMSKAQGISRTKTYTYGTDGLLVERSQPGGKYYSYTYDAYGNLTGVDGISDAVQWNLEEYTGRRTVSSTVLDDNTSYPFITTHLLDEYGYLDSIKTSQDDYYYQDYDYNFSSLTGNLTSTFQTWMLYPHTYTYDNLDRLMTVKENNQTIMSMSYASNGNIQSKTGVGSYTYNSSVKPHAVATVSNTDGMVNMEQEVIYNLWGKVSGIYCYNSNSFYYYVIDYGPDLERVETIFARNYDTEYEKFLWGDYEEKLVNGITYKYYYVEATDGLAALYIDKSGANNQASKTTKVITDHLGSIMSLIDNQDWVYDASFDVWGNRNVSLTYSFDPTYNRGYTGHEQIDDIHLIDMGGRIYDPVISRFLSPDNFVQSPSDPQNFNRYSYCLNNPLKYTDPTGELSFKGVLSYLFIIPLISPGIPEAVLSQSLGTASNAALAGVIGGAIKGTNVWDEAMSKAGNSFLIDFGLFQVNDDLDPLINVHLFASRFTGELRQTMLGNTIAHARNVLDYADEITYYKGVTLINMNCSENHKWGFTLGPYINSQNIKADLSSDLNFRHEFGHTFQSTLLGPGYINFVGIPSLIGSMFSKLNEDSRIKDNNTVNDHMKEWYETQANKFSENYCSYFGYHVSAELKEEWINKYYNEYSLSWFWFVFAPPLFFFNKIGYGY